jgi:hypothetical protein
MSNTKNRVLKYTQLWSLLLFTVWFVILSLGVAQAKNKGPEELLQLEENPSRLRLSDVRKQLPRLERQSYIPLMRKFMLTASLPWDIRTQAYILLGRDRSKQDIKNFTSVFNPLEAAASAEGTETFNTLAKWYRETRPRPNAVVPLIFPGSEMSGVNAILKVLAGKNVHEYLWALYLNGYRFQPVSIEALAETDDQLTRKFLNWYVGAVHLDSMQGYLVDQLQSSRPNKYPSQTGRYVVAFLTLFISEVMSAMDENPPWLGWNTTPKSLALQSLAVFNPPGKKIKNRQLAENLMKEAKYNASGKDRGQWQLTIDIMCFFQKRHELYPGHGDAVLDSMVRQALTKCGPLKPFVAAEEIHQLSGIPFPLLQPEDKEKIWKITRKTFDAKFLASVVRALPNEKSEDELTRYLLSLQNKAVKGSLRESRCWSAPVEDKDDWALAVGELGLIEAIPSLEKMLYGSTSEGMVTALGRMKEYGAPVLDNFMRSDNAQRLKKSARIEAIQACKDYLPKADWHSLAVYLRSHPYFSGIMEKEFWPAYP